MTTRLVPARIVGVLLACLCTVGIGTRLDAQRPAGPASAERTVPRDDIREGFRNPPQSARPRVWWHWLSGNVARRGITLDLEWMQRIGVAGAQMFDGDMGAPRIVDRRVTVLSPEWLDDIAFAASEAERLGLELGMAAAPGWSETGGPWVKPEWGMKKLVWSELRVAGGRPVRGRLPALPSAAGPFQAMASRGPNGRTLSWAPFARDVAVLAFPAPKGDVPLSQLAPRVSASADGLDLVRLTDGELERRVTLPAPATGAPTWVRYDFDRPVTMRALAMVGPLGGRFADGPTGRVEASDDGMQWRAVRTLVGQAHNPAPQRTFAFPATTARSFRVVFDTPEISREPWPHPAGIPVAELAFVPGARVDLFEDQAGFGVLASPDAVHTPEVEPAAAISSRALVDLTDRLGSDGTLDWTPPEGDWVILRVGYSLTGRVNHPATPEGTGPEVDKLDADLVRAHLDGYLAPVAKALGPLFGSQGLRSLLTDSWEAGTQNWTERMAAEFERRRGYALLRFLPVLTGRVVDSAEKSDAFLWDFRRTIADLVAEHHYGTITRFAKEHALSYYGEATGAAWPTVADGMQAKSFTDIPMGEFWAMPFGGQPAAYHGVRSDEFPADVIETASTAHVYGRPLVAAEAFTSSLPHWTSTPWSLKWVADKYFAMGVNRVVIHTSPHQPGETHKPGLTLGPFGQAFTRNETWAELAGPWIKYLSRVSYLLQQGTPVADILYFYGEGAPSGVPYREPGTPADPRGYGFDYVNADALLRLARVDDGRITFPGGASYRVLVLPPGLQRMTLPMITRLHDLVAAGAVLVGPKPAGSPSLASADADVRRIADELWPRENGRPLSVAPFGKGRVYSETDLERVLDAEHVRRDFDYSADVPGVDLRFAHRRLADRDVYFVTNQTGKAVHAEARFAVAGREAQQWDAVTGAIDALGFRIEGETTAVPLELGPYQSTFVVFQQPATSRARVTRPAVSRHLLTIQGEWTLRFPEGWGAPAQIRVGHGSWTSSTVPAIRYFSGTATYERVLEAPGSWFGRGERIILDLGRVGDVAEVALNGKLVGGVWTPPYRIDITEGLRSGRNQLQIRVANVWHNRFVGDAQSGARKYTFTNAPEGGGFARLGGGITADTPLLPSGLLEPVKLEAVAAPAAPAAAAARVVPAAAALTPLFQSATYRSGSGSSLPYRYYAPSGAEGASARRPLVLFLHGEEAAGTDGLAQLTTTEGATIWLEPDHLAKNPTYVLAPQAPPGVDWGHEPVYGSTVGLLKQFVADHRDVDRDRIYHELTVDRAR